MAKANYNHDIENCSECTKLTLKASAPYKATDDKIREVSQILKRIPRLNTQLDDDLDIKVGVVGYHGSIDTSHHSLVANFKDLKITLVLHIVVIDNAVEFKLEQNSALFKKAKSLGAVKRSPRWIAAAGLACAEQFGKYSYLTNNCHHYCQLLGASMGISVYSFKSRRAVDGHRIRTIHEALKKLK